MRKQSSVIRVNEDEIKTLTEWSRRGKSEHRLVERAKIILLANESKTNQQIAEQLHTRTARRNGRLLVEALSGVSQHQVWRIQRRHDICLERRRSWCISTDPEFGPKAADIVGLYLNPPENALVRAVDEKVSMRWQSGKWLQPLLQAARNYDAVCRSLEVATGDSALRTPQVTGILEFMNTIVAEYADREVHVILDNLNAHKPKRDRWLKPQKRVHTDVLPMAESGGVLVQYSQPAGVAGSKFPLPPAATADNR